MAASALGDTVKVSTDLEASEAEAGGGQDRQVRPLPHPPPKRERAPTSHKAQSENHIPHSRSEAEALF